jgi:hypothetical protein
MYTPFGSQTVTYSEPQFDQAGFDAATAKYNSGNVDRNKYYRQDSGGGGDAGSSGATYFDQASYDAANAARGAAPTRESFTTSGGQPTVTQTLNPQAQQTLDAQMRVQTALANLSQTGANNAQSVLNSPFNPNLPAIQSSYAPSGNIQSSVNPSGNIQTSIAPSGNIQSSIAGYNPVNVSDVQTGLRADQYGLARANTQANTYGLASGDVNADTYGLARGTVPLQYSLDTRNLTQMPTNSGINAQQAILSRLNPTIEAGDLSFRQSLANQGLAPGTFAYDTAMRNREQSKNDLYTQAALQGINVDMSARQQGLNELNTLGSFGNQAQLAGAGLYNSAVGQNFGQGITANQLKNQAIGQNFGQGVTADQLYNSAVGQNFNQALAAQQANNAAQAQQYGQNLGAGQFVNAAQAQQYGQNLNSGQFANAAQQQQYGQNLNDAQFVNTSQQQLYNQNANNAQFNNQAVQQSLAQQSALRAQPLNEILGLMGGSQIQLPQFQGYQGSQVAPAPIFAGTQAQAQNAMQNYGIQQSGNNAMTQGLFSALGTAAMFAPKFSDRRLKSNIVQIGTHPLGIGIYEYDIFGNRERGVMADEVAQIMPDAIIPHSSGYMMVNYGKL